MFRDFDRSVHCAVIVQCRPLLLKGGFGAAADVTNIESGSLREGGEWEEEGHSLSEKNIRLNLHQQPDKKHVISSSYNLIVIEDDRLKLGVLRQLWTALNFLQMLKSGTNSFQSIIAFGLLGTQFLLLRNFVLEHQLTTRKEWRLWRYPHISTSKTWLQLKVSA